MGAPLRGECCQELTATLFCIISIRLSSARSPIAVCPEGPSRKGENMRSRLVVPFVASLFAILALAVGGDTTPLPQNADPRMSFFITSVGPGQGANLGGLAGADAHCQRLATSVGVANKTWRAYLSTSAASGATTAGAVHAKYRIGSGPWYNAKGVMVARDVEDLHSDNNKLSKENSLTEKGEVSNGRGDTPNRHDILTGSQLNGTAFPAGADNTCQNWTSSTTGSARLGHHDRQGGGDNPSSWNSAHGSSGCSQQNLQSTGGDGLFYCFSAFP